MGNYTDELDLFLTNMNTDGNDYFNFDRDLTENFIKIDNFARNVNSKLSLRIGKIVKSILPIKDSGLHLLDGSLLQGEGIYKGFVEYIAELYTDNPNANYFTTENAWQLSVSVYGVCGKFVYDSNLKTVRLPKITGIIEGTTDISALGELIQAGLPSMTTNTTGAHQHTFETNTTGGHTHTRGSMNITGEFHIGAGKQGGGSGAFYDARNGGAGDSDDDGEVYNPVIGFDASRSWTGETSLNGDHAHNGITALDGNHAHTVNTGVRVTSTVQPQTIKVLYYIVVATSAKTDIQVDIDNIATDLNGKADRDLSNTTPAISFATALNNAGIRTVVETYQNGTSWYRVYSDGWCEQGGKAVTTTVGDASKATVALLKEYVNTQYAILAVAIYTMVSVSLIPNSKTTSSFSVQTGLHNINYYNVEFEWQTAGYIS